MIQVMLWLPVAVGPGLLRGAAEGGLGLGGRSAPASCSGSRSRWWRASTRRSRPSTHGLGELDPRPRRPLPARGGRDQPLPDPADGAPLGGGDGLLELPAARSATHLLLHARARRDGHPWRLPGPGPAAVRPLLRSDAGAVLVLDRHLRGREPDRRDDQDDRLHAGGLAADARGRDRHRDPRLGSGGAVELLARRPARPHALERKPGVDLPVLRSGLPDQDAGRRRPRLAAGRLPGRAAAGAGAPGRGALEGRRLRLPAGRAAPLPRCHRPPIRS